MKKDNKGFGFYTVRAEYKKFIIEKKVKSKNQYNAAIDFLSESIVLFDYIPIDDLIDDILILSVEQEAE